MNVLAAPLLIATIALAPAELIKTDPASTDWSWVQQDSKLWLYAHLAAGEAQFCSDEEQRDVISVADNRVQSDKFPDTPAEVIF